MYQTPPFSSKNIVWRDGKKWFDQGVNDFKELKNYWYMVCLLFAVLLVLVTQLAPVLMPFMVIFLSPMMTAYMMALCQQLTSKQSINAAIVIQSIQAKLSDFLLLGVISALLSLLFQQIHMQLLGMLNLPVELNEEMVKTMTGKEVLVRALLNLFTNLPVVMALAFSPALILFKNFKPIMALKSSFMGVIKGWKGFLILILLFMLVFMAVVVLASLVLSVVMAVMGTASQALINVIVFFFVLTVAGFGLCAQYQAYCDIFEQELPEEEINGTEIYTEI